MTKPRPSRTSGRLPAAAAQRAAVVDHSFVPVRAKLLEVAAFLDRVERYGAAGDFRCAALRQAAKKVNRRMVSHTAVTCIQRANGATTTSCLRTPRR